MIEHRDLLDQLISRTLVLLETEYPNSLRLDLRREPAGAVTPRALHPAFYGCYDWHSSVHSHWQVVRALRARPDAPFEESATAVLDRTLTPTNIAIEMAWVSERPNFEMPYGMAWLLRLCGELQQWNDGRAARWLDTLRPLEAHAAEQIEAYCTTLTVPMRGGLHNQSAFSLGLAYDAVAGGPHEAVRDVIAEAAARFFAGDTDIDLRHEPSAADFLSPALSAADLMRRVLAPDTFAAWFDRFTPLGLGALRPVTVVDPSSGQLSHWAGLNLSRSWMLSAIADALPDEHTQAEGLRANADAHAEVGLALAGHDDYMISHWVPTFAVYLVTRPG